MAADVEESIKHVISVAHDDDAFSSDSDDLIRAWIRQCISAAHIEPHRAKDLFLLLCENSGIIIVATRKSREKRGVGMDGCCHTCTSIELEKTACEENRRFGSFKYTSETKQYTRDSALMLTASELFLTIS